MKKDDWVIQGGKYLAQIDYISERGIHLKPSDCHWEPYKLEDLRPLTLDDILDQLIESHAMWEEDIKNHEMTSEKIRDHFKRALERAWADLEKDIESTKNYDLTMKTSRDQTLFTAKAWLEKQKC